MENIVATEVVKNILQTYNNPLCKTQEAANNKSGTGMELCESTLDIYRKKRCGILKGFVNGSAIGQRKYDKIV